jgi:hypothetical protein
MTKNTICGWQNCPKQNFVKIVIIPLGFEGKHRKAKSRMGLYLGWLLQ